MFFPVVDTRCNDCGLGLVTAHEWYMVNDAVWEKAWAGRRKPWHEIHGQEILCIGCLENRIGRLLVKSDFTDCPLNKHKQFFPNKSNRLKDRLTTKRLPMKGNA